MTLRTSFYCFNFLLFATGLLVDNASADEIRFREPYDISQGTVSGISSMDAGDIDLDGLADIVAIEGGKHAGGRKTFAWFQSPKKLDGAWKRFALNPDAPLRSFLGAAKLADMDSDGDLDLIVSSDNHSGGTKECEVFVFVNPLPDGEVTDAWKWHTVSKESMPLHHINDMEIADMDGDEKLDIVVRSLEPNQILIFFQNDMDSYQKVAIDTGIERSEGLAVGLIDDNSLPDITYTGYWLQAPSNPRSEPYRKMPIDPEYHTVNQNTKEAVGDIDGDGKMDVILAPAEKYRDGGNHDLAWYRNSGRNDDKQWKKHVIQANVNNHHTVKLGDIDNDGDLDVVTGVAWGNMRIEAYFNDGKGSFGEAQVVQSGKGLYSGVLADLGDDGDLDIIGQDTYANESKPWVYENLMKD